MAAKKTLKPCTAKSGGLRCELPARHTRKRIPHQCGNIKTGVFQWGTYLSDPPPPPPIWDVKVERIGRTYKTVFNVDQQYFTLVETEVEKGLITHKDAGRHARFIRDMFLKAIYKLKPQGQRGDYSKRKT